MPVIDQHVTWRKVEERLEHETDPILRRNLELLLLHMKAEAALDMETLMSTVSERARYQNFVQDGAIGPVGKDAVRQFYEDFAASGAQKLAARHRPPRRRPRLHPHRRRDAHGVPGSHAAGACGIEVDDLDADYLFETRMAVIWPIDEHGLFIGEDSYTAGDGFAGIAQRKIDPSEIVTYRPAAV